MGVRVKFETPHVVGWEFKWYADGFLNRRDYAVLVGLQARFPVMPPGTSTFPMSRLIIFPARSK